MLLAIAGLFLLYKLLDFLIRVPKRSIPTSQVNNILITGCDSGFGRLFALRMVSKGFKVFAACLTEQGKLDLEGDAKNSCLMKAFVMDVRHTENIEEGYKFVQRHLTGHEGVWALVNNAGVFGSHSGPVDWLVKQDYQDTFSVNVLGMAEVTRVFLPLLKRKKGRIVNVSSVAARVGFTGSSPYTVSKWGVKGFSDTIRPELKVHGISVHIVEPGLHATNMTRSVHLNKHAQDTWDRLPQDSKEEYGEDYLQKVLTANNFRDKVASTRVDDVVDVYEHAVLGLFPRGRYLVGFDARKIFWPLSKMPEWLFDAILSQISDAPVPKCCQS